MRKLIIGLMLITILASLTVFTGCVRVDMSEKNGPITSRSYDFTDFTGVEVGNAFELEVVRADTYSVNITAGENIMDRIRIAETGGVLKITLDGWSFSWWWLNNPKVTITMPVLKSLNLSGASQGTATGFKSAEDFMLKLSGASNLDMDMETGYFTSEISGASSVGGRLTAAGCDIDLSGASDINVTGSGGDIKIHGSGASHAELFYFTVNNADAELSGASSAHLEVKGRLDVDLSGASTLEYLGNPTLGKQDVSGASDLKQAKIKD
ncbi:MAG: head GIN domain-containing protein [Dehalococcoidales bacterium]